MVDAEDVTFAVQHAGGEADGLTIASDCRAEPDDADVALAEAVENGWLERFQDDDTGRIAFRLTPAGTVFVNSQVGPSSSSG